MAPRFKNLTFTFLPVKTITKQSAQETRSRALNLYKAWYRQIPPTIYRYRMDLDPHVARSKLREIFFKNSKIEDEKLVNALLMRGEMELNETVNNQKEDCHIWKYFRQDQKKPRDFLSKFLDGR